MGEKKGAGPRANPTNVGFYQFIERNGQESRMDRNIHVRFGKRLLVSDSRRSVIHFH
uniref:ATP synthase CF0 subunit I n=1 Tax=Polystichum yaanense TaxID=1160296 RepID=UPI0020280C36|nr:ATP synthase CF0 subunit I [Polystichum yaanense]UPP55973.1 ATP synthase CF0 subunit I [Polystichum yaanense]UQK96941.1 ATP synthase CF0 subunit I [Polystichum sp. YZ-2022a]